MASLSEMAFGIMTATLFVACVPHVASAQTEAPPDEPTIAMEARVKIHADAAEASPRIGRFGTMGRCLSVWVPDEEQDGAFLVVPIGRIDRIFVSTLYHARFDPPNPRPIYREGMDTKGEEWEEIAVEEVRADDVTCTHPSPPVRQVFTGRSPGG